MGFRIELFVDDLDASLMFYERALGFRVVRREADYASLLLGDAVLGLAPIAKLPAAGEGPGFTRALLAGPRGAGVEIVLEVDDLDAAFERFDRSGYCLAERVRDRPWGLRDFRVVDPAGYYLRITTPERGRPR